MQGFLELVEGDDDVDDAGVLLGAGGEVVGAEQSVLLDGGVVCRESSNQIEIEDLKESVIGNGNPLLIRQPLIDQQQLLELMLPDRIDTRLKLLPIKPTIPLLQPPNNLLRKLHIHPILPIFLQYFRQVEYNLLHKVVFGVLLHLHHILDGEFFVLFDAVRDYLLEAGGTAVGDLVDASAVNVVV